MDPLWKNFSFLGDAYDVVKIFKDEPHLVFLDSSQYDSDRGRYSFIGFDPFNIFHCNGKNSLAQLKKEFSTFKQASSHGLAPLMSGIVGYLAYDGDCFFGFYDSVIAIDHYAQQLYVCSSGLPEKKLSLQKLRAQERLNRIIRKLNDGLYLLGTRTEFFNSVRVPRTGQDDVRARAEFGKSGSTLDFKCNFSKEDYLKAVWKAQEYIRVGDIYQVNLSQRFELSPSAITDPLKIYQMLRHLAPSSFSAYFNAKDFQIMSSSPERFLRLHDGIVSTRPMKGTRPRSLDSAQDRRLKEEIIHSQKDKAELLMITDLERNDLGKVCEYGSVTVDEMRTIEEYPYVFQATSSIRGKLERDKDAFDVLEACFPGGSITGCPKIRAMEIIEELEPTRRGIYTGCLGYVSFSGEMDFNILIRTLVACGNNISFHVGGGIVADSSAEGEYNETLVKAQAMRTCLEKVFAMAEK